MPPAGGQVTVAELGRRLDRLESGLDQRFTELGHRLDNLGVVHVDTYEADKRTNAAQLAALAVRVRALEVGRTDDAKRADDARENRWSAWVAPVVTAVVAAVIIAVILRGGR